MLSASIGLFFRDSKQKHVSSTINVPQEVFEAVDRVIENQNCEAITTSECLYIIQYSEHGPFSEHVSDEWLPVYIAKIYCWNAGGIKESEYEAYKSWKQLDKK